MSRESEARDGLASDIMKHATPEQQRAIAKATGNETKRNISSEDAHRIAAHAAREADKRRGGK